MARLLLFPGILEARVLLNLLPADLSILPRNQHGARVLGKTGAAANRALTQKPGTDYDFLGKFGADLCGPEHLAKNPFPQSTVFLAKQARTCADPSIQTRNHGFVGKTGADLAPGEEGVRISEREKPASSTNGRGP